MLISETSQKKKYRKRRKRKVSQVKNEIKKKKDNINNKLEQQSTNVKSQKQLSQNEIHTEASTNKPMETAYSDKSSKVKTRTVNTRSSVNNFTMELRTKSKSESTNKMVQSEIQIKPISIRLKRLKFDHTSTPMQPNKNNRYTLRNLPKWDISEIK